MSAVVKPVPLEDVVKRRRLSLAEIPTEDAPLAVALAYWRAKKRGGLLPSRSDIDPLQLRPLLGTIHMVDASSGDPGQFRIRLHGGRVPPDVERKILKLPLSLCGSPQYGKALMEDYGAAAFTGSPSYHQVVASIDLVPHSYSRLILPLADNGRKVDTLMVCFNRRPFGDLSL